MKADDISLEDDRWSGGPDHKQPSGENIQKAGQQGYRWPASG